MKKDHLPHLELIQ